METVTGTPTDVEALLAALDAVAAEHGVVAQAFDARYVADRDHLGRAVDLAGRERARGEAIADDPAMEVLLYAAGRRQIDRALAMGASAGEPSVVVLAGDEEASAAAAVRARDPFDTHEVDLGDEATLREFFEVSDAELAAADGDLAGVVHERVALLVVER
ncbi:MAG: KEOPS complex subunit Cgi121 [Haloferacaceae archaeon]